MHCFHEKRGAKVLLFFEFRNFEILVLRRIRKIAKSNYLRPPVRLSAWKNSPPTGRIFMKFDI